MVHGQRSTVIVVSCIFIAWCSVPAYVQDAPAAGAHIDPSPDVKRVLATYTELMAELTTQVAAGGKLTARWTALEMRLSEEVKTAAPQLLAVVRQGDYEPANAAVYALRYAPEPEAAVAALLAGLDRFGGKMVNNIGLALEYLCMEHPALQVPIAPLTRALAVHENTEWNHQQKIAQVLEILVRRGGVTDPDGALAAALIPMLASQRVRVFGPAREILPKITRESLGDAPEPWAKWYVRTNRRPIDVAAGVYELAQIVRPAIRDGKETYQVAGTLYTTRDSLVGRLKSDAAVTRRLGRKFGIVIQLPERGFPAEGVDSLAEALFLGVSPYNLVVSPASDEFVSFADAAGNLRRLLR